MQSAPFTLFNAFCFAALGVTFDFSAPGTEFGRIIAAAINRTAAGRTFVETTLAAAVRVTLATSGSTLELTALRAELNRCFRVLFDLATSRGTLVKTTATTLGYVFITATF